MSPHTFMTSTSCIVASEVQIQAQCGHIQVHILSHVNLCSPANGWYPLFCDKAMSAASASLSDSYSTLWCIMTHIPLAWNTTCNHMHPQWKAMSNLPVEIWNQIFIITSTQVVEGLLMLPKQADVVGDWERLLWKACDGLHQFIPVNVQPEVCAVSHIPCHYFWTLVENEKWIRKTVFKMFLDFENFILAMF